jgi:RNA polymerase sigma factor (sigma-70 family)
MSDVLTPRMSSTRQSPARVARRSTFRGDSSIETWIHRILTYACIDRVRVPRRTQQRSLDDADDVSQATLDYEGRLSLMRAVRALPADERSLCALHYWRRYTYEETAAAMGLSIGAVRSRLFTIRARLRVELTRRSGRLVRQNVHDTIPGVRRPRQLSI